MAEHQFTSDWFTARIPIWERFLPPLQGEPLHTLEIGSHDGRSALWVLEHVLAYPAATITCVDPWENSEVERRFDRNVAASGKSDQLVKRKGPSWRELPELPAGRFAFVYIDGCREALNVLKDAVLSFQLLRPGGLLCLDDYLWQNDQRGTCRRRRLMPSLGCTTGRSRCWNAGIRCGGGFANKKLAKTLFYEFFRSSACMLTSVVLILELLPRHTKRDP